MNRPFYVDDYNIDSIEYLNIRRVDILGIPATDLKKASSSITDGGVATNLYYREKPIILECDIKAPDHDTLNDTHRTLMEKIQGANRTIKTAVDGDNVVYTATFINESIRKLEGGFLQVNLTFEAQDPIGVTEGYFTTQDFSITTATNTTNLTVGGNYYAKPVITVHISAISTSNPSTIQIGSDSGTLSISRDWTVGDVLVIDSENGTVKVNDIEVLFSGNTPELNIGSNSVSYEDDFTSRTVNLTVRYKKRYL